MMAWGVLLTICRVPFVGRVAEVTVRVVPCEILPEAAVMVVVPAATAVARPPLLVTVATDVLDELQLTCVVMS